MRGVQPHSHSSCGWGGGLGTRLDVWVGGRQQLFTVYEKNKFTLHYISCWYDRHVLACMCEQEGRQDVITWGWEEEEEGTLGELSRDFPWGMILNNY